MKILFSFTFLFLIISCCGNITKNEKQLTQINFETDKSSYSRFDNIDISLANNTEYGLVIGLRCKKYLEMKYQKKELDSWSGNLEFWYKSLGCMTTIDTIKPNSIFNYSMKSEIFDSTGIYRLVFNFYDPKEKKDEIKYSNEFEVK